MNTITFGILGGLGYKASAKLYEDLVSDLMANEEKQYPAVLVWNVPITKELDNSMMNIPNIEQA